MYINEITLRLGVIKHGHIVHKNPWRIQIKYYQEGTLKKSLELVGLMEGELAQDKSN